MYSVITQGLYRRIIHVCLNAVLEYKYVIARIPAIYVYCIYVCA